MFTGIVEWIGVVERAEETDRGVRLTLRADGAAEDLAVGASLAVNGTCLTAVEVADGSVAVEVVEETLRRTNLGAFETGHRVNLERPVRVDGRLDGHLLQGHVDGTARVLGVRAEGGGRRMRVELPDRLRRYLVEKGSVAVDGVSLTVASLGEGWFEVALVPHTLEATVLGERGPGDVVNLEVDMLAKYVERMLGERRR